jgi:hypothetical protein
MRAAVFVCGEKVVSLSFFGSFGSFKRFFAETVNLQFIEGKLNSKR